MRGEEALALAPCYGDVVILTYRYRVKDAACSTRRALRRQGRSVNSFGTTAARSTVRRTAVGKAGLGWNVILRQWKSLGFSRGEDVKMGFLRHTVVPQIE
jgi:hypothetical protein